MIILYDIKHRITLVQRFSDNQPSNLWNLPMDKADFRIYTGVDNQIEFALRKKDRKVVNIVGRKVRLVLKNRYTNEVLAQPYLTVVDTDRALMLLTLPKALTWNWPVGALSYGAIVEEPDGSEILLFVDEAERGQAFCYVMASPVSIITPSTSSQIFDFPKLKANESHYFRLKLQRDGQPFDVTGYDFRMQLRLGQGSTAEILDTLTTSDGLNILHEDGEVFLTMSFGPYPTLQSDVTVFYDILALKNDLTDGSDTWLEGTIKFEPGVTYQP